MSETRGDLVVPLRRITSRPASRSLRTSSVYAAWRFASVRRAVRTATSSRSSASSETIARSLSLLWSTPSFWSGRPAFWLIRTPFLQADAPLANDPGYPRYRLTRPYPGGGHLEGIQESYRPRYEPVVE